MLESQNHQFHIGKHKGWSTWVILERQVVKWSDLGDLARFDRSDPPQTSVKNTPKCICEKVELFWNFQKNKSHKKSLSRFGIRVRCILLFWEVRIAKLRFEQLGAPWRSRIAQAALFHTCTRVLAVLGAPNALLALLVLEIANVAQGAPKGARGVPAANRPDPL